MSRSAPNKRRLDELFLRRLRPQAKAFLIWDTRQTGLAVYVQPTGHMAWKCIYKCNGRKRDYHIADVNAIGLAQARAEANQIMYRVAQGQDPAAERRAQRGAGTFGELAARYRSYAERKNKSWRQADRLVRRYLIPRWANLPAAAITRGDVKNMMRGITAPILANQVLAAASACFSWAIREEFGGVTVNPCVGVERNRTNQRERVLSASEFPTFWAAFENANYGMVLKMILLTGQRPVECCCMRTEHISDGWWALPGAPVPELGWPGTKNGENNRVWLSEPAQQIIAMGNIGFVFPGASVAALGVAMRAICKAFEMTDPVKPHDLRRTNGTTITSLGFGRAAMDRIHNHKDGGVGAVYDRYEYADENRTILEAVAAKYMESINPEGPRRSNVVMAQFHRK